MLENTEDFEIICNGILVSIHQVKAYNSSSYGKYSDALLEIMLELYKQQTVVGKIHTWKAINSKQTFQDLDASIKDDLKVIFDEYQNTNPKDGSSIIEKAVSTAGNKPKKAAILKAAFPDATEINLFDFLNDIYTNVNNTVTRLESYLYKDDNNRFCDLDEINNKIKGEISKALNIRNITNTPEQLEKTFLYFLGMMDRYIIKRHKEKQEVEKISITFNEIIEVLEADHVDIGAEHLAFKFKEQFVHQIDEYISDPDDYTQAEENIPCNLKNVITFFLSLNPTDLWAHYRSFSPHLQLDHENNTENALLTDLEGVRNVLIKIFHEINFNHVSLNTVKNRFSYCTTSLPHKKYLPTTITNSSRAKQIEQKITSNKTMIETLFEFENLIYQGEKVHTFSPVSQSHTEAPPSEDEDLRSKRNDVLKNITLVPISTAKAALI